MVKALAALVLILLCVLFLEVGYLVFLTVNQRPQELARQSASPRIIAALPSPSPMPSPSPLPSPPEPERRKIYDLGSEKNTPYKGEGLIKAGDVVSYAVGYFKEWQNIEGSDDKYLILTHPQKPDELLTFRVGSSSAHFKEYPTNLAVESVEKVEQGVEVTEDDPELPVSSLTPKQLDTIIQKGDAVIVLPYFDPPELDKKDEKGVLLASYLILRRKGGRAQLRSEITQTP